MWIITAAAKRSDFVANDYPLLKKERVGRGNINIHELGRIISSVSFLLACFAFITLSEIIERAD